MRYRTAILAAVLSLGLASATAHSKPLTAVQRQHCLTLSTHVQQLAYARDDGVSRTLVAEIMAKHSTPAIQEGMEAMLGLVYDPPRLSPERVKYITGKACRTAWER